MGEDAVNDVGLGFYDHMEIHSNCIQSGEYDDDSFSRLHEAQEWARQRARNELDIQSITTSIQHF
jgi:hypothetical protein